MPGAGGAAPPAAPPAARLIPAATRTPGRRRSGPVIIPRR
jgi:hypothetical protein